MRNGNKASSGTSRTTPFFTLLIYCATPPLYGRLGDKGELSVFSYLSRSPIRIKLLLYFVPILVSSIALTGYLAYTFAVNQLEKNAYYLLNDTIEQTGTFLNDKFYSIFEQLVVIENNSSFKDILSDKDQDEEQNRYNDIIDLSRQFEEVYQNYFQMIDSIYVAFNNGRSFHLEKDLVLRHVGIDLNQWMRQYQDNPNGYYWLNNHQDKVFDTVEPRNVFSIFKMIGTPDTPVSGIALINMRESAIMDILQNVKVSPNGTIVLISPEGATYARPLADDYRIGDSVIGEIRQEEGDQGSLQENSLAGQRMMISYSTLPLNKWRVAAIVPEKDILQDASRIKGITFLIVCLILIVVIIAATIIASSLSNPIRFLSKQVKRMELGDLNVSFDLREKNEIGVLANGLESLVASVQDLLVKIKDEQEQKRQIELLALQAQIQPHFLYNTLGSIKHLIDLGEKEKASLMVSSLTRFFRIAISRGREVITLREEIEHVRNYLQIQHIRYSRNFDFEIDIDDGLLELPIPKLTLQPLVENAIYHGIKNKPTYGLIRISGERQGHLAAIQVFDDGAGMSEERLEQLRASIRSPVVQEAPVTFGLRNVHLRLALHFGPPYGLELESEEGAYTISKVIIPYAALED